MRIFSNTFFKFTIIVAILAILNAGVALGWSTMRVDHDEKSHACSGMDLGAEIALIETMFMMPDASDQQLLAFKQFYDNEYGRDIMDVCLIRIIHILGLSLYESNNELLLTEYNRSSSTQDYR